MARASYCRPFRWTTRLARRRHPSPRAIYRQRRAAIDLIGVSGDQIFANKARRVDGVSSSSRFLPTFATSIPLSGKRLVIADVNGDGKE